MDDEAEVCDVVLDECEASISITEEIQLHVVSQVFDHFWRKLPVHLEADEVGMRGSRAGQVKKVVLASGEEDASGLERLSASKVN